LSLWRHLCNACFYEYKTYKDGVQKKLRELIHPELVLRVSFQTSTKICLKGYIEANGYRKPPRVFISLPFEVALNVTCIFEPLAKEW